MWWALGGIAVLVIIAGGLIAFALLPKAGG